MSGMTVAEAVEAAKGFGVALLSVTPEGRRKLATLVAIDDAWLRLAMVAGPERVGDLRSEVDRRERLFAERRAALFRTAGHPTLEAIRSVERDVAAGVL